MTTGSDPAAEDSRSPATPDPATAQTPETPETPQSIFRYQAAGIAEHKGAVPWWLWIVAVLLTIWSVYYVIVYWNPPVPPH